MEGGHNSSSIYDSVIMTQEVVVCTIIEDFKNFTNNAGVHLLEGRLQDFFSEGGGGA